MVASWCYWRYHPISIPIGCLLGGPFFSARFPLPDLPSCVKSPTLFQHCESPRHLKSHLRCLIHGSIFEPRHSTSMSKYSATQRSNKHAKRLDRPESIAKDRVLEAFMKISRGLRNSPSVRRGIMSWGFGATHLQNSAKCNFQGSFIAPGMRTRQSAAGPDGGGGVLRWKRLSSSSPRLCQVCHYGEMLLAKAETTLELIWAKDLDTSDAQSRR